MVRVGDVNIHAVIGGEGPPLALLHGFPQTWWEWRKMMLLFAGRHTVPAVDLGGLGEPCCRRSGRTGNHGGGLRTRGFGLRRRTGAYSGT
jgi:pimeloyl-ACP methyl ester carboxylesterase